VVRGLAHGDLELDGGPSAQRGLAAAAAVVGAFDPGDNGDAQLVAGVSDLAVEDVVLQQ
jgi:hypothetical protein